jgi:hypothetical protein
VMVLDVQLPEGRPGGFRDHARQVMTR